MEGSFGRSPHTLSSDIFFLHGLSAMLTNGLLQRAPAQDRTFIDQLAVAHRLLGAQTCPELVFELDALFSALVYYQENRQSSCPAWVQQVRVEIEQSFRDPNFSIALLAERFSLNASYLSHHFKKHVGLGILDYLHRQRIEEAKRLLASAVSVREAAEKCGYLDSRSLIRAFKRYVGITPGQYTQT